MTKIEWTRNDNGTPGKTWNPTRGCSVVSPGCHSCYAMKQAHRFSGPGGAYEGLTKLTSAGPQWTGQLRMAPPHTLAVPLSWRKPCRIFVNSMSDLFHEAVSNEEIAAVFGVMASCPQHTFQVLTKRAERMRAWFEWIEAHDMGDAWTNCHWEALLRDDEKETIHRHPGGDPDRSWPLPNVWIGVSVEDQRRADERIPHLLATPAAVRFVSAEPLLEAVNLRGIPANYPGARGDYIDALTGVELGPCDEPTLTIGPRIHWVIIGSESGHGARPMATEWAEKLRDQCGRAGVAFFTKQIATVAGRLAGDRKGGDPRHWPGGATTWPREFPHQGGA